MKKLLVVIFFSAFISYVHSECTIACRARYFYKIWHPPVPPTKAYGSEIGWYTIAGTGSDGYFEDVWSNWYTLSVIFYSGIELNEIMGKSYFQNNSIIGYVKWSNGGFTYITINDWGTELKSITEEEVLYNNVTKEKISSINGYDGEKRYWEFNF